MEKRRDLLLWPVWSWDIRERLEDGSAKMEVKLQVVDFKGLQKVLDESTKIFAKTTKWLDGRRKFWSS
jgi:hypothetical protein